MCLIHYSLQKKTLVIQTHAIKGHVMTSLHITIAFARLDSLEHIVK